MSRIITRSKHVEDSCCICLEDMNLTSMDNPIKVLPCGHRLHQNCFDQHKTTSFLCPLCRKNLYNGFVRLSIDSTTEEIKDVIINKIIKPDLDTWETDARKYLFNGYTPIIVGNTVINGILDLMDKLLHQKQWWRDISIEDYNNCLIDTHTPSLEDFREYSLYSDEGYCNMYLSLNNMMWILRTMSLKDGEVFDHNYADNYNYANELSTYINEFYRIVNINMLDSKYHEEFKLFFDPMEPDLILKHFHWMSLVWNNNLKQRKHYILNGAKITLKDIKNTLSTVSAFNHFQTIYPYFILWLTENDNNKRDVLRALYQTCGVSNRGGNCKMRRKSRKNKYRKNKSRKTKTRKNKSRKNKSIRTH